VFDRGDSRPGNEGLRIKEKAELLYSLARFLLPATCALSDMVEDMRNKDGGESEEIFELTLAPQNCSAGQKRDQ